MTPYQYPVAIATTCVSDVCGKKFVEGARLVILEPAPDQDGKILVSAWGRYQDQARVPISLLKIEKG